MAELPLLVDDGNQSYLHGAGPLAQIDAAGTRYDLLADGLGSVRNLIDGSGAVVGAADYSAFGKYRNQTGVTSRGSFGRGFTGEYYAQETGMWHLRARDLHPGLGRFLSADPVQPNAPGTQGYNRYAYVANNPTTWVDPSGYSVEPLAADQALLGMMYAMHRSLHAVLRCALSEECRDLQALMKKLGSRGANFMVWTAEELQNALFSTYPHQPTPVDPGMLVFSIGLSNTPIIGDLYDLYTGVTGYDPITGQYLAGWERLANIAGAIPLLGLSGANIRHGVHAAESLIDSGDELAQFIGAAGKCRINSFSEETPVATDEGAVPISEVDVGDRVLAWDELTDTAGYYIVSAAFSHIDATIVELTIDGETLETTADHPFYLMDGAPWLEPGETAGRWVEAGDLQVGDAIRNADGTTGTVTAVKVVTQPQRMYNLTVADAHTFFVGEGEWLVHNAKCYRVEGTPNLRLDIDSAGNVSVISGKDGMLHLSFGGPGHAEYYLQKKIKANLPGAHVKEFEVADEFLDTVRRDAIPQGKGKVLPGLPQIDDPKVIERYNLDSEAYGIPSTYFQLLIDSILPRTGKVWR